MKRTSLPPVSRKLDTKSTTIVENILGIENIPDAIFTSDWHLRDTIPICRNTVEFEDAQWKKVLFISDLQKKYKCPVFHAGDLFDHWKPSPYLLAKTIQTLPNDFYTIYGNHDLPQHNLELQYKCGIYVLQSANKLQILPGVHWGQELISTSIEIKNRKILIWHTMTYQGKKLYPGQIDPTASKLLRKYTEYDLILTGHNHQAFVEEYNKKLLVNPGSITRQEIGQIDFKPRIYLYFAKTNTVKPIYLPIKNGVINKSDTTKLIEERNERIDAFISKLNTDWDEQLSFDKNLEIFYSINLEISKEVKDIITTSLDI